MYRVFAGFGVGLGLGSMATEALRRHEWPTVSAATAVLAPPTPISPAVTPPVVAVPEKSRVGQIPPEPVPGLSRVAEIMRFGFPGLDNIRSCKDYVISYDKRNRTAHWVLEHLTKASVARNEAVDRAKSTFVEDEAVHPYFRSQNTDYKVLNLSNPKLFLLLGEH